MIEKHYSHLMVSEAVDQLRGNETRRLLDADVEVDPMYQSRKATKVSG